MFIVFFWNFLNHHQVPIADAMYDLLVDNFRFVATLPRDEKELKGGEDYSNRPYCVLAGESKEAHKRAMKYAELADVCVFGACSQEYAVHRAIHNPNALSFECGERWLKRGWLNVLSPVLRKWWTNYMRYYRKANFYKLCSSAFAAQDDEKLGCYKGRHFKWGYFTSVESYDDDTRCCNDDSFSSTKTVCLMWCARLIDCKHPELVIKCAKRLNADGYKFQLDMYGDGPLRSGLEERVEKSGLSDCVEFQGNVPNEQVRNAMRASDIFLFTSDRQEGWGAVANEAMAAGCCLIASDRLGAAPYLIRDGINGFMFRDCDADSLYKIVKHIIDNPEERIKLSKQAREDMVNIWSPRHGAESLLLLIEDLQKGKESSILVGPCSKA